MNFRDVPMEPIALGATLKERRDAFERYRRALMEANPAAFDDNGEPLTVAQRFLRSFWFARRPDMSKRDGPHWPETTPVEIMSTLQARYSRSPGKQAHARAESIIKSLRPTDDAWLECVLPTNMRNTGYPCGAWFHEATSITVLSAVEVASDTGDVDKGPEYHISIAHQGPQGVDRRTTSAEAAWVLDQFGLVGAEEDNHVPNGMARNFWRPVADPLVGIECACKVGEPAIVEDKGDYIWRHV